MPEFTDTIEVSLPRDRCFEKARDFSSYASFISALKGVEVDEADAARPLVTFRLEAPMMEIVYTCRYTLEPPGKITWEMTESNTLKENRGYWLFEEAGGGVSRVTYSMAVKFPMWMAFAVTDAKFAEEIGKTVRRFKEYAEST